MKQNKLKAKLFALVGMLLLTYGCETNGSNRKGEKSIETISIKFVVTDALQTKFYDADGNIIDEPQIGDSLYGQDAHYQGIMPFYTDNGDGTVSDNNTGLMWQYTPPSDKMSYDDAMDYVEKLEIGGYTDWRLLTIKESFSIAN